MAGRPRSEVIDESVVGVYHVWMRCIRRMFLCGYDPLTQQDFSHRKDWFVQRLDELSRIFAVDACVWAILSNHYHLIVRNRPDLVREWCDAEVVRRWWYLFPERRDDLGLPAEPTALEIRSLVEDRKRVAKLRKRLSSISWFMKALNEWFAKRANACEDQIGHFWAERFGCRNLVDEGALLLCSIYIDLNEIRAEMASRPEDSRYTSAYTRILARVLRRAREESERQPPSPPPPTPSPPTPTDYRPGDPDYWMCPLSTDDRAPLLDVGTPASTAAASSASSEVCSDAAGGAAAQDGGTVAKSWRHGFLPLTVDEYLEVLDRTGRLLVEGKPGAIDPQLEPILVRLGIQPQAWLTMLEKYEVWFHRFVGRAENVLARAAALGQRWVQGISHCRAGFS